MKKIKKLFISSILTAIILTMAFPAMVFAGGINSAESGVIGAASGTFTYNGQSYVASSAALAQLTAYLGGVDLTAAQASRAIGILNANVRGGVESGYLVPVGGSTSGQDSSTAIDSAGRKAAAAASRDKKTVVYDSRGTGILQAFDSSGKLVLSADPAVKNTGYNGMIIIVMAAAAGGLLVTAVTMIIRKRMGAHEEEQC